MLRKEIKQLLQEKPIGKEVTVMGWVRTKRKGKGVRFLEINDGSTIHNVQVVLETEKFDDNLVKDLSTGASVAIKGILVESAGEGQDLELQAEKITLYGAADPVKYPLQKKGHGLEFLREQAHLRPRTNTFAAVLRIRHHLAFAVHQFFHNQGYFNLHTPIITGADAEGAGEMFHVTNFDLANVPLDSKGKVKYKEDFFGKESNLTVSGQLNAELAAMGLGKVYTFGPTFRAEQSHTTRHLAEFWMIEPEAAFMDLQGDIDLAEAFVKSCITHVLEQCSDDLDFLQDKYEEGLQAKLQRVASAEFARITYTEAVKILQQAGQAFEFPVEWGMDLQSEHERYLCEQHIGGPVAVINYPKDIKAFYMKQNEDGKTVAAMDVLMPKIGEMIGGSQREEDHDKLLKRMQALEMDQKQLWWYLETRKFGTCPHAGFGLGFERLVQYVTGMANIRDVIPFPRTPKNLEF